MATWSLRVWLLAQQRCCGYVRKCCFGSTLLRCTRERAPSVTQIQWWHHRLWPQRGRQHPRRLIGREPGWLGQHVAYSSISFSSVLSLPHSLCCFISNLMYSSKHLFSLICFNISVGIFFLTTDPFWSYMCKMKINRSPPVIQILLRKKNKTTQ